MTSNQEANSRIIPLDECQDRGIYEIRARNFSVGVFNAEKRGFIGIREKLGSVYLFTEYHWDADPRVGTARPFRLLGAIEDDRIRLWERYPGSICEFCGEAVEYREELRGERDPETGKCSSWPWVHIDPVDDCEGEVSPYGRGAYHPLFNLIEDYEEQLAEEREAERADD